MNQIEFARQASKLSTDLFQHAMRFTNDTQDAEVLIQDTMVKAFRCYNQFEQGSNLKGWLYTILKNTFLNDYKRKCKARTLISKTDALGSVELKISANFNTAESSFIQKDIALALKTIPQQYAKPFISYFEGYRYHEIAQDLGLPIGTVKTRIHEARRLLKQYLGSYSKYNYLKGTS